MGKKGRRYSMLAFVTAVAVSHSAIAVAEDLGQGSETGIGVVEGNVETDIYQVILPTETKGIFDFIVDPQGLINKTDAVAYDGKKFEENSTVFFKRSDGETEDDYSSTSDSVTITNKSSIAVDVSLQVSMLQSSVEGITMTEDREFTEDKSASLYLAVIDGKNVVPIGKEGASIDITIDAAPEGAYEYIYESDKEKYVYKLIEDTDSVEFDQYSFQLTGAANEKGDWSDVMGVKPEVMVAWKITPKKE